MEVICENHLGIADPAQGALIAKLISLSKHNLTLILAENNLKARHLAEDFHYFHSLEIAAINGIPNEVLVFPDFPNSEDQNGNDPEIFSVFCDRLEVLQKLIEHSPKSQVPLTIFTSIQAIEEELPDAKDLDAKSMRLEVGHEFDFEKIKHTLATDFGYFSEALCEGPGEFSVRGGIIDIYPVNLPYPVRIDLFGDEVEDIRSYNPTTQKSENPLNCVRIFPAPNKIQTSRLTVINDYINTPCNVILCDPASLQDRSPTFFYKSDTIPSKLNQFFLRDNKKKGKDLLYGIQDLELPSPTDLYDAKKVQHKSEALEHYRDYPALDELGLEMVENEQLARNRFLRQLLNWKKEGLSIVVVTNNDAEKHRIQSLIEEDVTIRDLAPDYRTGDVQQGFVYRNKRIKTKLEIPNITEGTGFVLVTSNEIFGRHRKRNLVFNRKKKSHTKQVDQILDFNELVIGDHLVHLQHGICIYRGIKRLTIRANDEEVISLEFANEVLVHLPLAESHLLSRYVGLAKTYPKLGSPGSKNWEKARAEAEKATLDLAGELLRIQAERDSVQGFAFDPDTEWQKEFEASFIHKETPDQQKAIDNTKRDMEQSKPMDRLICGDVGYGKTEVALRAAFKAVMSGKQVAILVPTTILCQQHMNTFRDRMTGYPVQIEMLSRFRTPKEQKQILERTARGEVDILIGTHRLLGRDVSFKDLGLLVVDEEQRFGVKHKERLKQLRATMDILTMSATPIPRTLYMALSGARELSTIETSPVDRLPIQTYVKTYDDGLIKQAVQREIDRGGQVFYLHNRVDTINQTADHLRKLFPKLQIAVGHGQMAENHLEHIMTDFVAGEYDVLVCTTIIETGLDLPNCNTIIIEGADRFGLSQLYQLRGRVGRFKQQAYAYLLLHRQGQVFGKARKRLASIRQFNQLGAGFRIAMRDLELRGAGNLLGAEQSGHISGVGFDLYCQLLRQSVAKLKGEKVAELIRAEVRLDFLQAPSARSGQPQGMFADEESPELIHISSEIPEFYISDSPLRIQCYRRFAQTNFVAEVNDLEIELTDRFGIFPREVSAFIKMHKIRCLAQQKRILHVSTEENRLICKKKTKEKDPYIRLGKRFPRLTNSDPLLKLDEIMQFIDHYQTTE
jgi:transcription-repair coupling factor (superfamily II helicase)